MSVPFRVPLLQPYGAGLAHRHQRRHRHHALASVVAVIAVLSAGWGAATTVGSRLGAPAADVVVAAAEPAADTSDPPPARPSITSTPAAAPPAAGGPAVLTVTLAAVAPEGMTVTLVMLLDSSGAVLGTAEPVGGVVRFPGLAGGSYEIVTQARTAAAEDAGGAAISAAVAARSAPIDVPTSATLVVTTT